MYHRAMHSRGFSQLLRSAGHKGVQLPVNNKQTGASAETGGSSGNRKGNDAATQRFMDAKTSAGHQPGGARISHGPKKAWTNKPSVRIAEGSTGTSGRVIHHATEKESAAMHPGKEILIGAKRSGRSSHVLSSSGRTHMSPEVESHEGMPAHQSVINRGIKPHGGFKHAKKFGMAKRMGMARKINW